jgi:hypothetical protein
MSASPHSTEPIMTNPSLRNLALLAAATLVLAAGALIPSAPATAATSVGRATYCLTSDSENDCGFTSLAQCKATASGGLGECDMVQARSRPQDAYALDRPRTRSSEMFRH